MRHFLWFDKIECLFYVMYMFVSAVIDPGGIDSARALTQILTQYGFQKVQRACWENGNMSERDINDLKKDIDRVTDYYDSIRMYQYPVQGMLAITEMMKKQWKRSLLRPPASEMQMPSSGMMPPGSMPPNMMPPQGGMMPPMSGFPGMYG